VVVDADPPPAPPAPYLPSLPAPGMPDVPGAREVIAVPGTRVGTAGGATGRGPEGREPQERGALSEVGRYQIAGSGDGAWRTVLDTRTGAVYNYRSVDGRPGWWPITTPLV